MTARRPTRKQTIWEIRVNSILKLDRAAKAAAEEQEQDELHRGSGRIGRFLLSEVRWELGC